jgi:hypothetical protein
MNKNYLKFIDKINLTKLKVKTEIRIGTDCSEIESPIQALELLNINLYYIPD